MSQAGILNSSGGGGSNVQQLTPDDMNPVVAVGNNINVFGVEANGAKQVDTHNIAGDFYIEDRTFVTEYVVDPSSTIGEQGTFTDIQDAVDAAETAGRATGRWCTILIRPGLYINPVVIPEGTSFHFLGLEPRGLSDIGAAVPSFINAAITLSANSSLTLENIQQSGFDITVPSTASIAFVNCRKSSSDLIVEGTIQGQGSTLVCPIQGALGSTGVFDSCEFDNVNPITLTANWDFQNCLVPRIVLVDGAEPRLSQCSRIGSITGIGDVRLINCELTGTTPINNTGNATFAAISESDAGDVATSFFGANPTPLMQASTVGNILQVRRVAGNIVGTISDYVLAVTDTSIARTVTLPSSGVLTNQVFVIKDESLAAGTNNITVSVNGGVKTIDGQLSQVINSNGGSFSVYYNGTNYFIL